MTLMSEGLGFDDPLEVAIAAYRDAHIGPAPQISGDFAAFLALFPQFIPDGDAVLAPTLLMATIIVLMDLVWFTVLAVLVSRARRAMTERGWARRMEIVSGSVLMALGIRLAFVTR